MSKLGGWKVNVAVGSMPQQVATAFGKVFENFVGATYTPIAYLGSQVVNGTNHAILAEQTVMTGVDTKNIVCIILNEKPGSIGGEDFALVSIDRVVDGGGKYGGTNVDVVTDLTPEIKDVFNSAFEGFVGSKVEPFALLGTKVVKGVQYKFAATVTPVVQNPEATVQVVTVNGLTGEIEFEEII